MLVKATQPGVYGNVYRHTGDKFQVEEASFSETWMSPVKPSGAPAKEVTKAPQPEMVEEPKSQVKAQAAKTKTLTLEGKEK